MYMKKSIMFKQLSSEAETFAEDKREKILGETNMGVFSVDEKFKMRAMYQEIVGRPAPTNCNGLCITALKVVRNWVIWNEVNNTPTIEDLTKPLDDHTKKELIKMYPGISSKLNKSDFISAIENGES